ncbi:hypothetical protein K1719_045657 [Acacia pycnantha]|nr:hypothetical protein K1719_045657 [Acacia pycnantha]
MASPPPYTLNVIGSEPESFTGTTSTSDDRVSSQHFSSAFQNINSSVLIIVIVLAVTFIVSLSLPDPSSHQSPVPPTAITVIFFVVIQEECNACDSDCDYHASFLFQPSRLAGDSLGFRY